MSARPDKDKNDAAREGEAEVQAMPPASTPEAEAGRGEGAGAGDASATGPAPSIGDFGVRLREYREANGLTLKQVATMAGVSIGILSQIERGINSPSLKTVEKVRLALGLKIGFFFSSAPLPPRDGKPLDSVITRREDRPQLHLTHNNISKELLHRGNSRVFEMMVIVLPPGGHTRNSCYPSEKGGLVLEGAIDITIENETNELKAGDSFLFDGNQTHNIVNRSAETARVMWIVAKLPNELLL